MNNNTHKYPLLVSLDLDECLIYSLPIYKKHTLGKPDFSFDEFQTFKRPGLDLFIKQLTTDPRFVVGVWTSATRDYGDQIIKNIFPDPSCLQFFFARERCVKSSSFSGSMYDYGQQINYFKDLQKVVKKTGHPIERIIAVDDVPSYYARQYSNLVKVPEFIGQKRDNVLQSTLDYLRRLAALENVRPVEKRGWLSKYDSELTL